MCIVVDRGSCHRRHQYQPIIHVCVFPRRSAAKVKVRLSVCLVAKRESQLAVSTSFMLVVMRHGAQLIVLFSLAIRYKRAIRGGLISREDFISSDRLIIFIRAAIIG